MILLANETGRVVITTYNLTAPNLEYTSGQIAGMVAFWILVPMTFVVLVLLARDLLEKRKKRNK